MIKQSKPIEIPLTIKASSGAENDLQAARQKIEKTALMIKSIFKMIGISQFAAAELTLDPASLDDLLWDVQHLSEIGSALSESLLKSTMPILAAELEKEGAFKILKKDGGGFRVVKNS